MFQLTKQELKYLRSNFSPANINLKSRALPHAFTEQGIYMLATVLRGELAEQQSIFIMPEFREMRHYIKQKQQFVTQSEMKLVFRLFGLIEIIGKFQKVFLQLIN